MEDEEEEENAEDVMLMEAIEAAQNKDATTTSAASDTRFIITLKQNQHPRMAVKRPISAQSTDRQQGNDEKGTVKCLGALF